MGQLEEALKQILKILHHYIGLRMVLNNNRQKLIAKALLSAQSY